ncbi:MAG TPA: hypothetical protein VJI46_06630 [Candidatus Nanoarchaeia archaeon]|nr:hypothetical protein [Candidatus Nanoarchaeia archaeon]
MKKRGILQSEILTYVLISIGAILLITLGVNFISTFQEQQKLIEYQQIRNEIQNKARLLANNIGAVDKVELTRPADLKYLCMVNLKKRKAAAGFPIFSRFPEIVELLNRTNAAKNTFLMSDTEVLDTAYIEFLCPSPQPAYCKIDPTDIFEIYFIGVPGCSRVGSGGGGGGYGQPCSDCNQPNPNYFCGVRIGQQTPPAVNDCNAMFLIEDSTPTPYQSILSIVPLTQFPSIPKNFPYVAFYESGRQITQKDIAELIVKKRGEGFNIDTAIVINGDPSLANQSYNYNGTNYTIVVRSTSTPSDYINFWINSSVRSISIAPYDSEPIALQAALHATKMSNSPLFFVSAEADITAIQSIKKTGGSSLLTNGLKVYTIESPGLGIELAAEVEAKLNELKDAGNITILPRDTNTSTFINELAGEYGQATMLGSTMEPK